VRAADKVAKRVASPPAIEPTAEAETAAVAVVALTTSVRDVEERVPDQCPGGGHQPRFRGQPGDLGVRHG
jgi:hypothetical protein